jgi:ubiquinone/menaquinone biosynthesis C-methylase UbiE
MRPSTRATGPDRHREVAREYRRLAPRYDKRWASYIEATVRETMRRLPPDLGERVLDVACGTGALLEAVGAAHPRIWLAGVDISPDMLEVARRKLPAGIELQVASAEALPFGDASFDTVVTTNSFHFFHAPNAALAEMRRVLRPGGALVVTDWCDDYLACRICDRLLRLFSAAHHRIYGSDECRALLEGADFEAIVVERYKIDWLWGLMTATARKPLR